MKEVHFRDGSVTLNLSSRVQRGLQDELYKVLQSAFDACVSFLARCDQALSLPSLQQVYHFGASS